MHSISIDQVILSTFVLCLFRTKTFPLNGFSLDWCCLLSHTLLPQILGHVFLVCFLLMGTPNIYQTTRISKASPASHNTIFREVSANLGQFCTAGPNLIFFNTVIPSNITVASEMACSSFVCDAFAYFISSLSHALRQLFSTPNIVYHHL